MIRLLASTQKHSGHHSVAKKKTNLGHEIMFTSGDVMLIHQDTDLTAPRDMNLPVMFE